MICICLLPKTEIKSLLLKYGTYAHGTIKENGKITIENMTKEYALRPKVGDDCWKAMLTFRVPDTSL